MSNNGFCLNGDSNKSNSDLPRTPINCRAAVEKKLSEIKNIEKKLVKKTSKLLNISKFQPDFASTPTYRLPKTSTPIGGIRKESNKLTNSKRLIFTNNHHSHDRHHHHCRRHHHYHHHQHQQQQLRQNGRKEVDFRHQLFDFKNQAKNLDLQAFAKTKNSCIIINKAKIVNNNTKIKRKLIHQNQNLNLLANFQFYQ